MANDGFAVQKQLTMLKNQCILQNRIKEVKEKPHEKNYTDSSIIFIVNSNIGKRVCNIHNGFITAKKRGGKAKKTK